MVRTPWLSRSGSSVVILPDGTDNLAVTITLMPRGDSRNEPLGLSCACADQQGPLRPAVPANPHALPTS